MAITVGQQKYVDYDDGYLFANQANNDIEFIPETAWEQIYSFAYIQDPTDWSINVAQGADNVMNNGNIFRIRSKSASSTITDFTTLPVMYSDWTYSNWTRGKMPGQIREVYNPTAPPAP